jgi:hypothetical protein
MGGGGRYLPSDQDYEAIKNRVRRSLGVAEESEKGRNVFISFAHEDKNDVELLRGQARRESSDLVFQDYSVRVPYDSDQAEYIRRQIRERIRRASVTVVYISTAAAESKWVNWEVAEACRLGKGVVAVYKGEAPPQTLPNAVRECGAEVVPWRHQALMDAIERAAANRQ